MGNKYTIISPIDNLENMTGIWNNFQTSPELEMEDMDIC